jgi:hypothetical protein
MRTAIASIVCLVVGLAIGSYVGYRYYERHITNEAVQQMMQGMESSDRLRAAMAVQSITLIESGESSNAVQLLSRRIGDFYRSYAGLKNNEERTKQLLASIETVASTNVVVADEIHRKIQQGMRP